MTGRPVDSDSDVGYNSFVDLRDSADFNAGYQVSVVVVVCFVVNSLIFRPGTKMPRGMPCAMSPENLWLARL